MQLFHIFERDLRLLCEALYMKIKLDDHKRPHPWVSMIF